MSVASSVLGSIPCVVSIIELNSIVFSVIDDDVGRSMYLPVEWGPRIRETTLLGDSATTTRRAGLGCTQMGSPVD